jgi:tRNA(fMet)-specific endonuclease VapC
MALRARLVTLPAAEVVTTIISYEEQMRGWMAYLAQTRSVAQQVAPYRRLQQHLDNYRRIPVLTFDEAAAVIFQRLRRARLQIGTMDLKIAAIVLSREALLLSRNLTDFCQVPGLQVEDWTVER